MPAATGTVYGTFDTNFTTIKKSPNSRISSTQGIPHLGRYTLLLVYSEVHLPRGGIPRIEFWNRLESGGRLADSIAAAAMVVRSVGGGRGGTSIVGRRQSMD